MCNSKSKFTVLFEEPFWIGVGERESDHLYEVCKVTFGTEPKDCEVYDMILKNWDELQFNVSIQMKPVRIKDMNPKRMQRTIKKQVLDKGIGTKAQQALKKQQEQGKQERRSRSKVQREAEKELEFELKQEKRKKKHRGH